MYLKGSVLKVKERKRGTKIEEIRHAANSNTKE